jgi:hypothetical protein
MGFETELLGAWCEAATACGYLQVEENHFSLTRWAKSFLVSKSPLYMGYFTNIRQSFPMPIQRLKNGLEVSDL